MIKFYYRRPFSLVLDEVQEYHIKLDAKDPVLNYYETYGKSLWRDVKTFIKNLHDDDIQQISSDYDTTEYISCMYIWLHIRKTEQEKKKIEYIIHELNNRYKEHLERKYIPRLLSIIYKQLKRHNIFFANSICEYQEKYGKDATKHVIDSYFTFISEHEQRMKYKAFACDSTDDDE